MSKQQKDKNPVSKAGEVKKDALTAKTDKMEVETPIPLKEEAIVDYPQLMRDNLLTLLKAVELDDKNLVRRVWRRNTSLRKNLSLLDLQDILLENIPPGEVRNKMLENLDPAIKNSPKSGSSPTKVTKPSAVVPTEEPMLELESYLHLFIISSLLKNKLIPQAIDSCQFMFERFKKVNRQTLDSFVAKAYTSYALAFERSASNNDSTGLQANILPEFVSAHRTASLRLYEQSQATLINLILRHYVLTKQYTQARMFDASSTFPNSSNVGNNEQIRYLYYTGKIAAVQAEYSKSDTAIVGAIRKVPTNTGLGFRITVNKLNVVTKLLMGEVPERSVFSDTQMKAELEPYFGLVKSVRNGSVQEYDKIVRTFRSKFEKDDLMTLIDRLRSSVIKTGLRNISLAYSKISFADVKDKLELKSEKDAELICAKAIRDQIIDNAIIDSEEKTLISTEVVDMYSTSMEPKKQFNQRANFCIAVHNSALKAHKYPPNSHKAKKEPVKKDENSEELIESAEIMDEFDDM